MSETDRAVRWCFGATLASSAIAYFFSFSGMIPLLTALRTGDVLSQFRSFAAFLLLWLLIGLCVCGVLFAAAVRAGAPRQLWLVPAALSIMQLGSLAMRVVYVTLPGVDGMLGSAGQALVDGVTAVPYWSPYAYVGAIVGYPIAAAIGCWFGARHRSVPAAVAPTPQYAD